MEPKTKRITRRQVEEVDADDHVPTGWTVLPDGLYPELTDRERAVAIQLSIGRTCAEIAVDLGTSIKTIDSHRARMLKKLACRNAAELACLAHRRGYL